MKKNKAAVVSLAALCIALSVPLPSHAQKALAYTLYKSGLAAYDKGNYREALRIYRQCKAAADNTKITALENASILHATGECLRAVGQYKEAETMLKEGLKVQESLPIKKNFVAPLILNSLALLYKDQGRYPEAEGLWKQHEAVYKGRTLYSINNLAYLYFTWGKTADELEYVNKSVRESKHDNDPLSGPYREFNLALYAQQKGDYKTADEHYKSAEEMLEKQFNSKHFYISVLLMEESDMLRQRSKFQEAEKKLRRCLALREETLPADHPHISEAKVKLARVLADQGRYNEARTLATDALNTSEAAFGKDDSNLFVAKAKNALGNIYRQDGRYADAQTLLKEALVSQQKVFGMDNIDTAVTMRDLSMVEQELGNFKEAEALLKTSQNVIDSNAGPDSPERAASLNALGDFYLRDGKFSEAEPLFKKAMEQAQRVLGENNVVTARSARNLGELCLKQQKYAEAQTYLQQSLKIDEALYGASAAQIAGDLMSLASAYGAQGKTADAEPLLKRAAEIKNVLPGGNTASIEAPATMATGNDRPVTGKWALVIGVSNFKDSSINLKFAAKDATDFRNFLVNTEHFLPDHVKLLTDETATRENIIGLMGDKWLAAHVKPNDMVVVYVSSHGSRSQDDAGGVNFLVAHDTNKNSLLATGIPMQWLTKMIREQVHSDRVVLILDVCHSGAAGQGAKALTRAAALDPRKFAIGNGQMMICSSQAEQVSWESANYENSVFTKRLMEALQCNKDQTTLRQAYDQLKILVETEVLRDRAELQTPVLWNKGWTGKDPMLAVQVSK